MIPMFCAFFGRFSILHFMRRYLGIILVGVQWITLLLLLLHCKIIALRGQMLPREALKQHFGGSGAGDENGGVLWCAAQCGVSEISWLMLWSAGGS